MKNNMVIALAAVAFSFAVQAQDQTSEATAEQVGEPVATAVAAEQPGQVQYRTYNQGAQLLDAISTQVNDDLEARMATDVGTEVTTKLVSNRMLVSNN